MLTLNNEPIATFPIGTIYQSTNATSPAELYGGTWEQFGAGQVLVGVNASDTDFNQVLKTGGEKTHTLTVDEMPSHSHRTSWSDKGFSSGYISGVPNGFSYTGDIRGNINSLETFNNGGGQPHNNLQPYITVYRWRRVA